MAPLSLFRLKKQGHNRRAQQQQQQQQNNVPVPPRSPDSFFSPDRSPSLYAAHDIVDIVLQHEPPATSHMQDDDRSVEQPYPYPQEHPQHPPEISQETLFPHHTDRRDVEPPSLPVSALSVAHTITSGPPNLALRLSFDAEGSLGDSIQRYFMSSQVNCEPDRPAEPLPSALDDVTRLARHSTSPPPVPQVPQVPQQPPTLNINVTTNPTRAPINPYRPDHTANHASSSSNSILISHTNYQQPPAKFIAKRIQNHAQNPHDLRSFQSKLSSAISGDRSFHESPVLHASDIVMDISPSGSHIFLPSPARSTIATPVPTTPVIPKLPPLLPPEQPPPVPPKTPTATTPRKRVAPAPIKIPNGNMHAPKVIVDRVPAEESTEGLQFSVATATTKPAAMAAEPLKPQRHASRKRSVEEIEDDVGQVEQVGQVEHARRKEEEVIAKTRARPRTVVSSRKSTASAFFANEYSEFTLLPASSAGDRLSVAQPSFGRADSATLPEDSPGWQTRRFVEDDDKQQKKDVNVPPVPTLHPALLRRNRTFAADSEPEYEANRVLVVPKRESSLFPSAITAKLLPIALRQSDASPASEVASSSTFSQFILGYQHHNSSSTPQDTASIRSNKTPSPRPTHITTASGGSDAEMSIARSRTGSPATQPSTRGVSPSVPLTPAGILGLERTVLPSTAPANTTSRSTTASPILHPVPPPPRSKAGEDADAPDPRRDGGVGGSASQTQTWSSPRRTDSLRPSRAVELLKASSDRDRDSAVTAAAPAAGPWVSSSSVPATPGTALTQYLEMYTNTGEEEEARGGSGEDKDPASTGSSSFSTGPSSLFGTSVAGRSPYSLYQGTTPGTGRRISSTTATSKPSTAVPPAPPATTAAAAAASSPEERPSSSSSSSKTSHLRTNSDAFNGHFRTRSVSDAPPASTFVPAKNTLDRRPSLPESSTPGAADPMCTFLPAVRLPETLSSSATGSSSGAFSAVERVLLLQRQQQRKNSSSKSETSSIRSMEGTRPVPPAINTNPPRDLRESMFPCTPRSFSPDQPHFEKLLDAAATPPQPAAAPAPPPTIVAPEPASGRPRTPADIRSLALGTSMSRSVPSISLRGPMSSTSSVSTFSRRDRTLPIGPRKPTIKRKGAEQEGRRPTTAPTGSGTTRATTPPGQGPTPLERSSSIPPQTHSHSRTRTKSSASTSTSTSAMEKIARPTTPTFDTVQVQWRGLTLDAAKWMFSSSELHAMVGRAIRQSADPMCIRLLPIDLLDKDLPAALEDLEVRRESIKAEYKYQVKRRGSLMRALTGSVAGAAPPATVIKTVEELAECGATCDRLSEELNMVSDQIAQIARLRDGHSTSALAMALRKINTSFLRATGEAADLKTQVETLTAEREEAWAMAETVERELDELRVKVERMEQQTSEQQQQRQPFNVATSPLSRNNSSKGSLSRSTSRVSAARKSSMRVSKASLRSKSARSSTISTASWRFSTAVSKTPATSSPLLLVPPVPRIPRGSARNSDSADAYSPSPRGTPQALIDAQNELLEMLGIPINDFKNGTYIPAHRRSHSAAILSWAKSPPASPLLDLQPPASPVPIPKAPLTSRLFRSASSAEHPRLSRRRGEAYSTVDMEMIYDGILDDPETLFAVLKN